MVQLEKNRIPALGSSHHDCGSLDQVVMTRKRDQRQVINHSPSGIRQSHTETYETYQTFRGHKPQNTVVYRETGKGDDGALSELSASVRSLTVSTSSTPRPGSSGATKLGATARSNSCSPYAGKKGLNSAVSTVSLASTTTRPGVSTMPTTSIASFAADCVRAHNEYRRLHRVPDLKLSSSLSKYAQEWADTLSRRGVLQSRGGSRYGENIFCVQSSAPIEINGRDPVDQWYKEGKNHIFGKEPSTLKTGHFTQIVWRESEEIGVAIARNRNGQIFVVANYDPPGNVISTYSENVPPVGGFGQEVPDIVVSGANEGEKLVRMASRSYSTTTSTTSSPRQRDYVASRVPHNLSFSQSFCESDDLDAFAKDMLKAHNEFRKKHNVPDLVLDPVLNGVAQSWASQLGKSDKFGHNPSTKYGENVYCMWSSDRNAHPNPKDVCRSWYDEIRDFNFGYEERYKGRATTGHFTQVVWKSSKRLGVGLAKTRTGKVVVVCNYEPCGNVAGQYNANVPRPI